MTYRNLMAAVAAVIILISGSVLAAEKADEPKKNTAETYRLLNLFGDIFERVRSDYVDAPTDEQLIEAAIGGMLSSMDPHSAYMNAKNYREMQVQTRGEFGGLGIEVTMENGLVKVVSPIDDTPAFRAGVEPGDLITHLDGEAVLGMTLPQAVEKMRGRVGSDIKLTIRRGNREPFEVTLTRDTIEIQSVRWRLEDKVGYVRITSFSEQTEKNLKDSLAKIHEKLGADLQGVVLDLRNNPGGLLDQAVAVSDAFLDKGEIVSTRSRRAEDTQRFNARSGDIAKEVPIVVLINGGSASASEIVAGALQDHRRAILLGTKSFGKGSVQTIVPLGSYGAMRLTTARYYTPSGKSIQAKGIEPDIVVEQARIETLAQAQRRREADLRGALDKDRTESQPQPPAQRVPAAPAAPAAPEGEKPEGAESGPGAVAQQDYQLTRALDLIRGVSMFTGTKPGG